MTDAKPTPNDRQIRSLGITPPPELVQEWIKDRALLGDDTPLHIYIANRASQWGSDHELEACCGWLEQQTLCGHRDLIPSLRAARRPKPPTLKEQALALLQPGEPRLFNSEMQDTLRRALEQLDD